MYVPFGGYGGGSCRCGRGSLLVAIGVVLLCAAMIAIALIYKKAGG